MPKTQRGKSPSFTAKSELARHVNEDHFPNNRVSSAAFHKKSPSETYLSVNSLELETFNSIASYYRNRFQHGDGRVIVSCKKISEYNAAATVAGLSVIFDKSMQAWVYRDGTHITPAYKHRESKASYSHCGVEFVSSSLYDELAEKKFARRMASGSPRIYGR